MEAGFLSFRDEEHFSDFSLSLGPLAVDDDFDYAESHLDTSGSLWGTEQELNGDMAVLPVSGVASVFPKVENIKEDFAKVLTDWQEHIGYLQASDMGEDIDMGELSMAMPEKLSTDLPEDIFEEESSEPEGAAEESPAESPEPPEPESPLAESLETENISEPCLDLDVIGLDMSVDLVPDLDLLHVDCVHASSSPDDIDYDLLDAASGKSSFDLASYITGDDFEHCGDAFASVAHESFEVQETIKEEALPVVKEEPKITKSVEKLAKRPVKVLKPPIKEEIYDSDDSDNEDAIDVETVTEQMPVLQAGDVKSLLEQFEASEASSKTRPSAKSKETTEASKSAARNGRASTKAARAVDQSKQTLLKKSVQTQDSKLHNNIRDSLPKEVIDRIKATARKKAISVIPALSNSKSGARSNATKVQEAAATQSKSKPPKTVANGSNLAVGRIDGSVQLDHDYCSSNSSSNGNSNSSSNGNSGSKKSSRSSGGSSSSRSSTGSSSSRSSVSVKKNSEPRSVTGPTSRSSDSGKPEISTESKKAPSYYVPIPNKKDETLRNEKKKAESLAKTGDRWADNNSKKDSGLESGDVSDASEEQTSTRISAEKQKPSQKPVSASVKVVAKEPQQAKPTPATVNKALTPVIPSSSAPVVKPTPKPVYEMKIRSALATSILQLRKGVITKTKSLENSHKGKQMVSVLKKPPNAAQMGLLPNNPNESIVTTKNSSNNEVQNIIVQDTTTASSSSAEQASNSGNEEAKKPPRRKLNLAEYRSRREQARSDSSRTCSPVQAMTLIYVHNATTNTAPYREDPTVRAWSEREIVSVLKTKTDVEVMNNREKPTTQEMAIQTRETVFDYPPRVQEDGTEVINVADTSTESEDRVEKTRDRKVRQYRRRRSSSSSSRSRSHSRSRSKSKSRSRSRSRNRSKSRNRSRTRSRSRSRGEIRGRSRNRSHSRSSRSHSSRRSRSRRRGRHMRRRRMSRRRSSVSSSSSWSSRSRSHTRSVSRTRTRRSRTRSTRSRTRSLRSRSRSSRSRTRSRSPFRYSSSSRSTIRSHMERNKRTVDDRRSYRRQQDRRTSYDRYSRYSSGNRHGYGVRRRSPQSSYGRRPPYDNWYHKEKNRQMEERRVIYVGRLDENTTKADLRRRFEAFGPVLDISVHFREHGDNYGFVTFAYKNDAYEAVEHGNDDPSLPQYDLSFGGRRAFCKVKYADLDGMASNSLSSGVSSVRSNLIKTDEDNTFDLLLKEAKAKLRKRMV